LLRVRRLPLATRARTDVRTDMDDSTDEDDDSDLDGDERGTCSCKFCTPHFFVILLLIFASSAAYGGAIAYGFKEGPSWEQVMNPTLWMRDTRRTSPEYNFNLFDRDHDGLIGASDILELAQRRFGEKPSSTQVQQYIGKADANGDSALDHEEFYELIRLERQEALSKAHGN